LEDENLWLRADARKVLISLRTEDEVAIPELLVLIKHPQNKVRWAGKGILNNFGVVTDA